MKKGIAYRSMRLRESMAENYKRKKAQSRLQEEKYTVHPQEIERRISDGQIC